MDQLSVRTAPARPSRLRPVAAAACLLGVFALTACAPQAGPAPGQAVNENSTTHLRLADSYPPSHPFARHGVSVFLEQMEAANFDVAYFPSGQMGNAKDLAVLVKTDVLDMGPASAAYLEDELPLSSVSDLPNMTDDACVAANAMMDLLGEGDILYEAEYEPQGLRPLWVSIIPGYEVMMADTQVSSPEDLHGQVMRSSGGAFDVTMEAIGASAVSMPAADTYEAMTRGTIDGTPMPYVSVTSYNLEEVTDYSTDGLNLGSVGIPYVISEKTWDSLTPAEQDAVREAGEAANQSLCQGLNEEREIARQQMEDAGVLFTHIEGADAKAWDLILADVRSTWASSLDDVGLPGSQVLESYEDAVARHEQ